MNNECLRPDRSFPNFKIRRLSVPYYVQHQVCRTTDFEALKLIKGRSGTLGMAVRDWRASLESDFHLRPNLAG